MVQNILFFMQEQIEFEHLIFSSSAGTHDQSAIASWEVTSLITKLFKNLYFIFYLLMVCLSVYILIPSDRHWFIKMESSYKTSSDLHDHPISQTCIKSSIKTIKHNDIYPENPGINYLYRVCASLWYKAQYKVTVITAHLLSIMENI